MDSIKGINIQEPPHINDDISLDDATVDSVATFIDYVSFGKCSLV